MIEIIAVVLAGLYSFTWLRIPEDLFGVDVPLQFIAGSSSLVITAWTVLLRDKVKLSTLSKTFISTAVLFPSYLLADFAYRWTETQGDLFETYFDPLLFLIDLLKYVACFSAAFAIYYALRSTPKLLEVLFKALIVSGTASIGLSYVFLLLYFVGFTTDNEILAPTFEAFDGRTFIGIWPAGGYLPRVAGTAIEPQQLSVVFVTAVLLMLSRRYIKRFWPVALAGVIMLVLSQSKFALLSVVVVLVYVFVLYKPYRTIIAVTTFITGPPLVYFISTLPTFEQTLEEGLDTGAFVERISNFDKLIYLIVTNFWHGVGAGQYATYLNELFGFELLPKNYIANLDYLKIFAETGVFGFLLIFFLLWQLTSRLISGYRFSPEVYREQYLAVLIGALLLLTSMFFIYQFLQELFWINVGILLFLEDRQDKKQDAEEDVSPGLQMVGSRTDH